MEYILFFSILIIFFIACAYFIRRELQYDDFYCDVNKLCCEYDSWQHKIGRSHFDDNWKSAFYFCRAKFPMEIPLSLWYSFKPITMESMFTDEMKQNFQEYLNDNK